MDRNIKSRLIALLVCVAAIGPRDSGSPGLGSEPPLPLPKNVGSVEASSAKATPSAGMDELVTQIVLDNLPAEFEDKKDWGHKIEVWSGVSVWREGLKIKTRGQKREVNHGTWQLYRVRLIDPQQQFHIHVENVRELPAGRVAFDVWVEAQLDAYGQVVEWQRGVQLISTSADADAKIRLLVSCDVGLRLDPSRLPPDVILDPIVRSADLQLVDFHLRRISDFHGPVVKELGRQLRKVLENKIADQRAKIVEKVNRQIDKNRKSLRLSLHDVLASKWGDLAAKHVTNDSGNSP